MIPYLRIKEIRDYMEGKDVVYLKDLAEYLNISLSTVRRDLLGMESEGEVTLLNGGAATLRSKNFDDPVRTKKTVNVEQKEYIAKKAAKLVGDGDVIYIDSGTTPAFMTKYLNQSNLTIVTSSLSFDSTSLPADATVIFLGGELLRELESVVGPLTEKNLLSMRIDKAFIGANAYSESDGVFTFDAREARKKEIVMQRSTMTYLLADTSKCGCRGFAKAFDMEDCILISESDEIPDDSEEMED